MIKIEVNCPYCGRPFSFFWDNMHLLTETDIKHQWSSEHVPKIRYVNCPICSYRLFIRRDEEGWTSGIKKADGTYLWRKPNELS